MTDTRTKILKAASALFLEGGSAALSVRAIASRAEMSTIGIYSHFKGKQGILDALYMHAASMVSDAMTVQIDPENPRDGMLDSASKYLAIAEKYEAHYRLIFGESDAGFEPSTDARAAGEAAFGKLVTMITYLLPEGATHEERHKTALGFWALIHGFVSLRHHAAAGIVPHGSWRDLTLEAVGSHIDDLLARKNT